MGRNRELRTTVQPQQAVLVILLGTSVQPTKKQCTLFDVGLKTVPKETVSIASRVDSARDHSIRLHPAVVQQQEQRRQARQDRELRAADRKHAQRGKRGPYASGLGRWPQHLKSLAIKRHSRRYPGWLNIPMKTANGQPARGVLGLWGAVNDTTEHWKLNVDAFAKLSEKTLENWLRAHKIAHLEGGAAPAWKHPWTLPPSLVKEIEELVFQQAAEHEGLGGNQGGSKELPKDWEVMVKLWLLQLAHTIYSNNISPELVVNADQTGIMLVPVGKRTYARLGAKAIRLLGIDEKRQVVLTGKTKKCLPPKEDRKLLLDLGWSITWSDNNWSNLETSKLLFDTVHLPYLLEAKKKLNFPEDYPAVYLLDVWSVHFSEAFLTHLKDKAPWLIVKFILANCTSVLQPMDVGIQKPFKDALCASMSLHCTSHVPMQRPSSLIGPKMLAGQLQSQQEPG
ncbi:hypothetical protein EMCRGX_G026557 [Ephydatia muelleri]